MKDYRPLQEWWSRQFQQIFMYGHDRIMSSGASMDLRILWGSGVYVQWECEPQE